MLMTNKLHKIVQTNWKKFSSKFLSYCTNNVLELWLSVREFHIAEMLNPPNKSL